MSSSEIDFINAIKAKAGFALEAVDTANANAQCEIISDVDRLKICIGYVALLGEDFDIPTANKLVTEYVDYLQELHRFENDVKAFCDAVEASCREAIKVKQAALESQQEPTTENSL
ncbi:hypothetical protein MSAN_00081300 [Mycena sanguinolenta]|uniref:Uncharacterized protein n=1 Tax=Mycena sanguinolenta TaxID=230812 RepID=A0A8H7DJL8_9AGAR|nr:hypothetical protein MSAN_00081300 [Mycena sanguinolenta]